ncbi:MAG: HEAT repeat domain-containing protein [Leptospirales bacterium]|nr:HEAT repeat domain-containing protein [Leptospirales bacterium]
MALVSFSGLFSAWCKGPPLPTTPPGAQLDPPAVAPLPELMAQLKSAEWRVRSNATLEILRGEYRDAVPELLLLAEKDPSPAVRQTCALALGAFGERRAAPILVRMLRTDREIGREFILEAMVRLGDRSAGAAIAPLLRDPDRQLRLKAIDSLVQLQAEEQGGAILALAQQDSDSDHAVDYATALGRLHCRAAEGYLLALAQRERGTPALASALLALGEIRSRRATPTLVAAIAGDFDKGRQNAILALIESQDPAANDGLFALLSDARIEVRYGSARVIGEIKDLRSGPRALALLKQRDSATIGPAAYILGRQKYAAARSSIESMLAETSLPAREELARSLGWIGDRASIALLIRTLQESEGEGRYGAAWSLGVMEAREASPALRVAAASDDRRLALLAIEALGAVRDPESLEDLQALIKDRRDLAFQAVETVGLIPGPRSQAILLETLQSNDDELRIAAARALGRRKENEAIDALGALLDEDSGELREAAMAALSEISGQRFRNASQWRFWLGQRRR